MAGHTAERLILSITRDIASRLEHVSLIKVRAHVGIIGNERADAIARDVAEGKRAGGYTAGNSWR